MTNKARHNTSKPLVRLTKNKMPRAATLTPIIEDNETILDKARTTKKVMTGMMKVNRNSWLT